MQFELNESITEAELAAKQLTAVIVAVTESASNLDSNTISYCLQAIEKLNYDCQDKIAHTKKQITQLR